MRKKKSQSKAPGVRDALIHFVNNSSRPKMLSAVDPAFQLAKQFEDIRLRRDSIIKTALTKSTQPPMVEAFKDGRSVKITSKKIAEVARSGDYQSLKASLRINHVESFDSGIREICRKIERVMNASYFVSANLYLTPGLGKNALALHTDAHASIIQQLAGQKRWIFPQRAGQGIFHFDPKVALPPAPRAVSRLSLREKKILFVPNGILHRAEMVDDGPSIHITYALYTNATPHGLTEILRRELRLDEDPYRVLTSRELGKIAKALQSFGKVDRLRREILKRNLIGTIRGPK